MAFFWGGGGANKTWATPRLVPSKKSPLPFTLMPLFTALMAYKLPFRIVVIADRPVFISERSTNNTVYSSIGGNEEVTLTCVFDGFPVPRVRFNIFGEELNNSGITYAPGSASYRFLTESQSDFGFYTCKGTNSRGSASHTIEVHERGISAMIFSKPSLNLLGLVPA